jgi:hypothetical protein
MGITKENFTMFPAKLYSLTAWSLMASGTFIIFKKLVVEPFLPLNVATNAFGTFGLLFGLFALTGIALYQREATGMFGLIAYIVQWFGLAAVSGVDYARNYILPFMSKSEIQALLAGQTKLAFLVSALFFLAGVILFSIAMLRARLFPAVPVVMYMIGFSIWSLSFALPAIVALSAQIVGAVGIAWMGFSMAMQVQRRVKSATTPQGQPARA